MKEIFLDTETIDLPENIEGDILIELAFILKLESGKCTTFQEYFAPENLDKMDTGAMERTNLTPELIRQKMVEQSDRQVDTLKVLKLLVQDENNVLYIHNAKFDLEVLRRVGIIPNCKIVCTFKVATQLNDMLNLPYTRTSLGYLPKYSEKPLALAMGM
jgi:DNA polymerase III alpha subunit (gram-positive type)